MGLFDLFNKTPEHVLTYSPGGRTMGVKLSYDTKTGLFTYRGRFGTKAKFYDKDIKAVENREVSRTHRVILIQGEHECLGTFDVLTNLVCENIEAWINSRGEIAYDYDKQERGIWVNMRDVERQMQNPPHKQAHAKAQAHVADEFADMLNGKNLEVMGVTEGQVMAVDPIEQIKRLKELLDLGAITAEEYEAKKKELLNRL